MAAGGKPLKVVTHPGVPCSDQCLEYQWMPGWIVALALILPLGMWISSMVYHAETVYLPHDKVLDVSVAAKGCDVIFESSIYTYSWARLGYWKRHGTGEISLSDKALSVKTEMTKKEMTSNCILRVGLTDKTQFGKVVVKVTPDEYSKTNPKPSNIAESVAVKFTKVQAKKVDLSVLAAAETIVQGVQAEKLDMAVSGGKLTIIEDADKKSMVDSITLDAKDATVEVSLHSKDVALSLDTNSMMTASVAAAQVTNQTDGYYLAAGHERSSTATKLSITGKSSAIYVLAANHEYMTNKDLSLMVQPSAAMKEGNATFLDSGFSVLKNLDKWLQENADEKFMIYMHFTTPNAPRGTMRLMSTEVYTALSVTMFSFLSTGMLQPEIERLQIPVVGFPQKVLWPRRTVDGKLTEEEELQFSYDVFTALHAVLNTTALPSAKYVWNPPGVAYIFEKIPSRHGSPAQWLQRPITTQDNMKFYTAAIITIVLAFTVGLMVLWLILVWIQPSLKRSHRKLILETEASYRLNYQAYPSTFNVSACMIHQPAAGVFLRWQKREESDQFTSLTFEARSWPDPSIVVPKEGVDPWRIPTVPDCPNQQFFFFACQPPKKQQKTSLANLTSVLDQEMWGCVQLRAGDKDLTPGVPYQFRVSAFGGDNLIEKSSWSRPVMIQARHAFSGFPLLLWRTHMKLLPEDTFQYFLDKHIMPLDKAPTQVLTLSKLKLWVDKSCDLFSGEFDRTYGEDVVAPTCMNYLTCTQPIDVLEDLVVLAASAGGRSAGGEILEHDDGFYVSARATLPKNSAEVRKSPKTFEQVFGRDASSKEQDLAKLKYIALDFGEQTMPLTIGPHLDQVVWLDGSVTKSDGTSRLNTAKYETTWGDIENMAVGSYGKLDSQLILRDGLTPAAVLQCEASFSNSLLSTCAKESYTDRFPRIFKDLYQGAVFQWGQMVNLSWSWDDSDKVDEFDIVLLSEGVQGAAKSVPDKMWKAKAKETVVCPKVSGNSDKESVAMSPDQPYYVQMMRCRLEARKGSGRFFTPLAASSEFLITRPVTMENLELGYASFCIRNTIPQTSLSRTRLAVHGVRSVERELYTVPGYRAPLPTSIEQQMCQNDTGISSIVANPTSNLIADPKPLLIEVKKKNVQKEVIEKVEAAAKESRRKSAGPLEAPLLPKDIVTKVLEEAETQTLQPQRNYVDLPLNVYWNYNASWAEEFLLTYSCLPDFAMDGYLSGIAIEYEYYKLGAFLGKFDDVIRAVLRVFLFSYQIFWLWFPAIATYIIADLHDAKYSTVTPCMDPLSHADLVYLDDFTLSPSPFVQRWSLLDSDGRKVYAFCFGYLAVIIICTFYCNFIHGNSGTNKALEIVFKIVNIMMQLLSVLSVFCLVVYASLMAIWICLGAMINPDLIPIAIGIIGVVSLVSLNWNNLMTMKNHVEGIVLGQLDLVLHAIMAVFVGPEDSDEWLSMQAQATMSADIVEWLFDIEKSVVDPLLEQSKMQLVVPQWEMKDVQTRRKSIEFKEYASDMAADKCLATDFVPASIISPAQKYANDEATINGKRNVWDPKLKCVLDNDLTVKSLNVALALRAESLVPVPGQITASQKTELDAMAKAMNLRPATVNVLFKAFTMAEHLSETAEDKTLKNACTISTLMAGIRKDQLFTHFVVPKEGDKKSTMNKYLKELQNADMGMYQVCVAKSMTKLLDWLTVGREAVKFEKKGIIKTLVRRTVDNELNHFASTTVAATTMHQLHKKIFDKYDSVYAKDETKIFLDLGLIDDKYHGTPQCMKVLNHILDSQRDVFGGLYQGSVIAAIKNYFFPLLHTAGYTDVAEPCFLWYGALKALLTSLGWDDEEMEEQWLAYKWHEVTDGSGLLPYNNTEEVIEFIMRLADDGMWKAATKCLMLKVQIYGYAYCDIDVMGSKEKATKEAHAVYLDPAKRLDLKYLGGQAWPQYVKDAWESVAAQSKVGDDSLKPPRFLQVVNIIDFLQEVVYLPKSDDGQSDAVKLTMLNAFDVLDMDKCVDQDGWLWHKLPGGQRKLRGIWMELALEMFNQLDCVPSDLDVFYDNLEYQQKQTKKSSPVLQMNPTSTWLKEEYLPTMVNTPCFDQFVGLLKMVNCDIPEDVLKAQVFSKCPLVPGDDLGELRHLTDLGAALRLWMGFGLWKGGVDALIDLVMVPSPMRRMAHKTLSEEFAQLDKDEIGVLQPAQTLTLMHKLSHPGLSCDDISETIKVNLGLDIPSRKCFHYFTIMDVNCDGVMQADEFIPMMRLIMIDYFPEYVMANMGLSWRFIILFIIFLVIALVLILHCVQLIIATFTNGKGVASAIHSGFNSMVMAFGKMQSDAGSGFNDSVSAVKAYLSDLCMSTICGVLGLGKPVVDKIGSIVKNGI